MTNFSYRALQIVQSEEYLTEADLNLIRRYKRQTTTTTTMTDTIMVNQFNGFPDVSLIELLDTLVSVIPESIRTQFCSLLNEIILNANFFSNFRTQVDMLCDRSG